MTPVEAVGIAVLVIFALIEALKRIVPSFNDVNSKYIPLISLGLGIGAAVLIFFTVPGANLWILLGGIVTALGASGLHSTINTYKDVYTAYKNSSGTNDTIVSPNDEYPAS